MGSAPLHLARAFVTGGSGFLGAALLRRLAEEGIAARALARSDAAAATVAARGAEPVRGDVDDVGAMAAGMAGCDVAFHAAALAKDWGDRADFYRVNVEGTTNLLRAASEAGVRRVVHVSTEAVLADGRPIVHADEGMPRAARPVGLYPESKGLAEERALAAAREGQDVVIVRPRLIWGPGDTTLVPVLADAVRAGRFAWIDGGRYPTSTCHVDNVVEGLLAAAQRGRSGEVYFLTDGEPVEFRAFVTAMLHAHGVEPGARSIPRWLAQALATAGEAWARMSGTAPPVTRTALALSAHEVTVVDEKARRELGYRPRITRDQGLAGLAEARRLPPS